MTVAEVKPFSDVPSLPPDVEARVAAYQKQQQVLQDDVRHRHSDRVQANADPGVVHSAAAAVDVIFDYYSQELPSWEHTLAVEDPYAEPEILQASTEQSKPKGQWVRALGRLLCKPLAAIKS